jgi:hypothetical protein
LLVALIWTAPTLACNVPVFRYALERWSPDAYEIVVFHDGALSAEHTKLLANLQDYADEPDCPTNITLTVARVDKKHATDLKQLLDAQKSSSLPWMVVRYPEPANIKANVYAGPLDGAVLKEVFDSPLRRALTEKLLRGETAVWILVESGDKQKDDAAADWLRRHLAELEKTLKLPELTSSPKDKLRTDVALKIEFSLLRLSRTDPAEKHLVAMLLGMEEDLASRPEPIVYPVFGRGLALWAIMGKGINADNVDRAAKFLVGPCSCEIKAQNPGVDLLLTADWEERLTGQFTKAPELPPLTGLHMETAPATNDVSTVSAAGEAPHEPESASNFIFWRNVILALSALLVLLLVGSMAVYIRRK